MTTKTESLPSAQVIIGCFIGIAVLWLYWPVLVSLVIQLYNDEDYSFGLLLPFISAYIIYLKWPQICSLTWSPSLKGLPIILLALAIYISGKVVSDPYSLRFSFLLFIVGLLLFLGGRDLLRQLRFPLIILVFMLPLPGILTSALTLPLQLISSHLAAMLLRLLGIPLVLQGNVIDLGVRQLQVAAACSGLRYILSLMALGIIYCYFYQRQIWKAGLLLISLVPAAIVANAMRVAAMGIFPALMQGFLHEFSGWLIFVFCFAFLALFNWSLDRLSPKMERPHTSVPKDDPVQSSVPVKISLKPYLVTAMCIVILGGVTIHTISEPSPVPLLQSFDHFPLLLGTWQGNRTFMPSKIFEATNADSYFDAEYSSIGSQPVSLYIAHYEKQATAGGLGHNPAACMTGSGWHPVQSGVKEIAPGLPVNFLFLTKQGSTTPILVYYWNIHQGHWAALSNARLYKLFTIYNYLHASRTDWALIRLITPVENNIDSANERLVSFARLLIPIIPNFIKK